MSSLVRLAPITPASSATPRTSPFGAAAVDDEAHRLGRDGDGGLGDGAPGGDRLVGDVDHPRPPGAIDVREPAAFGAWLRSLVHRLLRGPAIRPDAALGYVGALHRGPLAAVEPPQVDGGAGGQRIVGLGHDGQGVGGGEGRDDVAVLPAARGGRMTRP